MICFTIALRSKYSTNQWDRVLTDFNNTLHSIFNQTCDDFRVYVGCNEKPDLFEEYDDRLHFVTVDLPIPKTWEEGCRDRSWKLLACAKQIKLDFFSTEQASSCSQDGVFVFPVDADDFVNRKITAWCKAHPEANGFKSKTGYRWVKGTSIMQITPYFGGTMNIMKMYPEDLPDMLPDSRLSFTKEMSMQLTKRYPIRWYDIEVERKFAELGKPLSHLPFRSTIYVLGTGANISSNDPANAPKEKDRFHPIAFLRKINPFDKRYLSKHVKEEFGMPL